jgi:hypothetical protein
MKLRSLSVAVIPVFCLLIAGDLHADRGSFGAAPEVGSQAWPPAVYIIDPMTTQKILPDTSPRLFPVLGSARDSTIRVSACRGQFEAASLVLRPRHDIAGITVEASDLTGAGGGLIPKSAVDIRLVKCWYQAKVGDAMNIVGKRVLVPELLLRDDSLVKVDQAAKKNYLRVRVNDVAQYLDISSDTTVFPAGAELRDSNTVQPFDVPGHSNKQVWLTLGIPRTADSGVYSGSLSLRKGGQVLGKIGIEVTVLPFDLKNPALEYGLYYRGILRPGPIAALTSEDKSVDQYAREMQDMKDHGVLYPTLYQPFDSMLGQALAIRKKAGLPVDKLYAPGLSTGSGADAGGLACLASRAKRWKAFVQPYGYGELYAYGRDEAEGEALRAQAAAWQAVHSAGVKVFAACYAGAAAVVGGTLDLGILNGSFNPQEVAEWHALGKKVFNYDNPQAGVEDADIYRRNYGIQLLCAGYDGAMDYAYQHGFGHIWNDFDDPGYRDHVFAYPTSDGVVPTIQWEGFREGVDDVRYLTTLAGVTDASAYASVCALVPKNADLGLIRETIIRRILSTARPRAGHGIR